MRETDYIRVAVVEDVKDAREGLKFLLSMEQSFRVVQAYESAEGLLKDIEGGVVPDVVLMDIGLPGMDGIEATREVVRAAPSVAVLILTIFEDEAKILESIRAGARGYILKNTKPRDLVEQILSVRAGGSPISPAIAGTLLREIRLTAPPDRKDYSLTARERQILQDIIEDGTYRDVARKYCIAESTAKKHILHIYQKLEVNSKVAIVKKVLKERLLGDGPLP